MNTQQSQNANNSKNNTINVNSDFDLDHLEFKPINKGLGFHQNTKKDRVNPSKRKVIANASTKGKLHRTQLKAKPMNASTPSQSSEGIDRNGLEAFYGKKESAPITKESKTTSVNKEISINQNFEAKEATKIEIFAAWLIDLAIVAFFLGVTGIFLVLGSGINIKLMQSLINKQELYLFSGLLFVFYYFLYFTILDVSGTPGKNTLNLKVVDQNGQSVRMKTLFIRTFVSLVSFILLGLPNILNIHGAISKTSVIKR